MSQQSSRVFRRNLPHWISEGSVYFITSRVHARPLTPEERRVVVDHLRSGDATYYRLSAAVVMPDHIHLLLSPIPPYDLSRVMKGIKGVSARLINKSRGSTGTVWQDESYDRIMRDLAEFQEKLQYMRDNPVKEGLAADVAEYEGWYCNPDNL